MKKVLLILLLALSLSSCNVLLYGDWAAGATNIRSISDFSEQMSVLRGNFPELYTRYINGTISIQEMYEYTDSRGKDRYHIGFYDR